MPILSGIFSGLTIFFVILALFSKPRQSTLRKDQNNQDDWLYSNFFESMYDIFCGSADPVAVSKALGLEYDKYMINCNIIGREPNFKMECMMRIVGTISFVLGIILSIVFFSPFPIILGIAAFVLLVTRITKTAESSATLKKHKLVQDLPRFVDLLLSALEINMPVELAIIKTAENIPCVVSDELKSSLAEMQMGAKSWQQALEDIAHKYEIDLFSDFVLDIITAYNKGVSITASVTRQSYEIKQNALLTAKERTAKMTTTILAPIVMFKIVPLMVIMMLPIIQTITTTFG